MSQTTVNLGHVPVNRGEYSSSATYYRDNIVQYRNSSYICNIEEPDVAHPVGITGVAPYDSDPAIPNTGWAVFANDSNGVGEGVYNVSVDHTTDGQPKKYETLSQALADVPQAKKKGGMSIKFIQSSDNKYVQFRYMGTSTANADFTNVANWYNDYISFLQTVGNGIITSDKYISHNNGTQVDYSGLMFVTKSVAPGMKLKYKSTISNPDSRGLAFYDIYNKFIEGYQMLSNEQDIIVPDNAVTCRATVETIEQLLIISTNEAISTIVKNEKELGLDNFPQIYNGKTGSGVATTDADIDLVRLLSGDFLVDNTLSIVVNSDCFTQIHAYGVSSETSSWIDIGIFEPNKLAFFTLRQNFKNLGFYVRESDIIQNGNYNYQVYVGEISDINLKLENVISFLNGTITSFLNGIITKSYGISDFPSEQQNYYLNTKGDIGDIFNPNPVSYSHSNTFWAKIILPKQSKLLFHRYKSTGSAQDLVITNFENVIKQKISYDNINDNEITLTDDCIVYVTQASGYNNALLTITYNSDYFSLIGRLLQIENSIVAPEDYDKLEPKSEIPLTKINQHPGFASIFHNWGFIGDSLSSGEIEVKHQGVDTLYDNYDFSWGQALCRLCGTQGYNFSKGGQYAKRWCQETNERSWYGAQTNIKDCYIIAFGVNDIGHLDEYYTAGIGDADTDIDVSDYNNNADSIIGWYGSIIQRLKTIQPKAKIFVTCLPKPVDSNYKALNIEIRKLATIFTNVYVFDLEKYAPKFSGEWSIQYRDHFHLKATGYQWYAWLIASYLDWYVRSYPEEFADVPLIGTSYERRD